MATSYWHMVRVSVVFCLAFAALACSGGLSEAPFPPQHTPNVVLVVVDTLRADALTDTRSGRPLMPKLRGFAGDSLCFANAISQASWTKPAMVSMFTSLYPEVHNVQFGVRAQLSPAQSPHIDLLPDSLTTMATRFREAGYRTLAVQSNPNLNAESGFAQGFDSYIFVTYPEQRGDVVTDRALEVTRNVQSPFFLYVHYMDPHQPYDPPPPYRDMFVKDGALPEPDRELINTYRDYCLDKVLNDVGLRSQRLLPELSERGRAFIRSLYDGEVRFTDELLDRLIRSLRERAPSTIVVVTADHGEEFWERGSVGHGKTVYQELVHVPLIVSLPDASRGRTERAVQTIDVLPTLAALLGWRHDEDWQGANLLETSPADTRQSHPVFSSTRTSLRESNVDLEAVCVWPDKLVRDRNSGEVVLFDLARDPREQSDRLADALETVARLEGVLRDHHEQNQRHPRAAGGKERAPLDAETVEEMQAIGYLTDGKSS